MFMMLEHINRARAMGIAFAYIPLRLREAFPHLLHLRLMTKWWATKRFEMFTTRVLLAKVVAARADCAAGDAPFCCVSRSKCYSAFMICDCTIHIYSWNGQHVRQRSLCSILALCGYVCIGIYVYVLYRHWVRLESSTDTSLNEWRNKVFIFAGDAEKKAAAMHLCWKRVVIDVVFVARGSFNKKWWATASIFRISFRCWKVKKYINILN